MAGAYRDGAVISEHRQVEREGHRTPPPDNQDKQVMAAREGSRARKCVCSCLDTLMASRVRGTWRSRKKWER